MKIGIATLGSRGDVAPFAALAYALRVAGHTVTMSAPVDSAAVVDAAGVGFVPMGVDIQAILRSAEGQRWLAAGDARAFLKAAGQVLSDARETIGAAALTVADGADALVAGVQVDDYAVAIGQAHGITTFAGHFAPWVSTSVFPNMLVSTARLRPDWIAGPTNLVSHRLTEWVYWRGKRDDINGFR